MTETEKSPSGEAGAKNNFRNKSNGSGYSSQDYIEQFRDFVRQKGFELPAKIVADGNVHPFGPNDVCRYVFHLDGVPNGWVQSWRQGPTRHQWKANGRKFNHEERERADAEIKTAKAEREEDKAELHKKAALEAERILNASTPGREDHPYLVRKRVKPHGLREYKGALVVPIWHDGKLVGLQFIKPDGFKPYLKGTPKKGAYYVVGGIEHANKVCIAEGFATAATVYQRTDIPCVAAFDAGNLLPVAKALKLSLPGVEFIICADDDWQRVNDQTGEPENLGLINARAAALAIGAKLAVPDFSRFDRGEKDTDLNDLDRLDYEHSSALDGCWAVHGCIERADFVQPSADSDTADNADNWTDLLPLSEFVERKPYPLDALPELVREAVEEVQGFTRAPMPMVAMAALSAASASVQHLADVSRSEKLTGPISLWSMVMAESGERKTALDSLFTKSIRAYELKKALDLKDQIEARKKQIAAWGAKRNGLLSAIEKCAKDGKPADKFEAALDSMPPKPEPVLVPMILRGDDTTENLAFALVKEWASAAVLDSEAGAVFGSHAMGAEKIMGGLSFKNKLWGGEEHRIGRRTSESFTVRGARFTFGLQVQPAVIREFQEKNGGLARGMGFWARFLLAEPVSTQGTRFWVDPPERTPSLGRLHKRLYELVEIEPVFGEHGGLEPRRLTFSPEGKRAWIETYNSIEAKLARDGDYSTIRDIASKAAENVARLAATLHILEHGADGDISDENIQRAAVLIDWHLNEARRFFADIAASQEERDAAKLEEWLVKTALEQGTGRISRREADRGVFRARGGPRLDAAIELLSKLGRARLTHGKNNKKDIEIRPSLLGGKS
jgi:putative DNA primase/helicase